MSDNDIRDQRIESIRPLTTPALLRDQLPLTDAHAATVLAGRQAAQRILDGDDDRLLVIVGPCSVHDPHAGIDYARRLAAVAEQLVDDLALVMRTYFEKPRSLMGWKGLINDPHLDGSGDVNTGLATTRRFLLDVTALGLPVGCEWLDPITPQYLSDAVSWGCIGARTVESQVHRTLASGMSMPIGVKNRTDGELQTAVDALRTATAPHVFTGVTDSGLPAIYSTRGNPDCHIVLRGGRGRPNYDAASVGRALQLLRDAGERERLMIDTSHDNSRKDHRNQPGVAAAVAEQMSAGQRGIAGVIMESFLLAGRQDLIPGQPPRYGQSITDACMDWDTTTHVLHTLAGAVRRRRTSTPAAPALTRTVT